MYIIFAVVEINGVNKAIFKNMKNILKTGYIYYPRHVCNIKYVYYNETIYMNVRYRTLAYPPPMIEGFLFGRASDVMVHLYSIMSYDLYTRNSSRCLPRSDSAL